MSSPRELHAVNINCYPKRRDAEISFLSEGAFRRMLVLERKRADRTGRPVALFLACVKKVKEENEVLKRILPVLLAAMRDTDVVGWHETNVSIGAILTEVTQSDDLLLKAILARISVSLQKLLSVEQLNRLEFSCQLVPQSEISSPLAEKIEAQSTIPPQIRIWEESEHLVFSNSTIA